jgi:hypothetical protein
MAITTALIPLLSQVKEATVDVTGDMVYEIDSRKLLINATGDSTHTVTIEGKIGQIVYIDITSLDSDSTSTASTVIFRRGDVDLTFNAATEQAIVQLTDTGFANVDDVKLFGSLSTSAGVFPA